MHLAQFPCRYTNTTIEGKYSCHSYMAGPTSVNKLNLQKPTDQKDLVPPSTQRSLLMRTDHIK